jgi:hypothetical protein
MMPPQARKRFAIVVIEAAGRVGSVAIALLAKLGLTGHTIDFASIEIGF